MSNVKEVFVKGSLPFDLNGNDELQRVIGGLHAPSLGLKMAWGEKYYLPNMHGGSTMMYHFTITGMEAIREEYLDSIVATFSKHGPVTECRYRDIEVETGWLNRMEWVSQDWRKNFKEG